MDQIVQSATIPPMPQKIAEAIVKVMAGVERLENTETNEEANYQFASIDDFLELLRPLCGEAGLIIMPDEIDCEVREHAAGAWLKLRYRFVFIHASGETWDYQPRRTIMVDAAMGSQAFGAAQSYALKYVLRGLFQIATGDAADDIDSQQSGTLPADAPARPKRSDYDDSEETVARAKQIADLRPGIPPDKALDEAREEAEEAA